MYFLMVRFHILYSLWEMNSNKKNSKKSRARARRQRPLQLSSTHPRDIFPEQMSVWLNYVDDSMTRTNVANPYNYFRFRANSVWDPDPLLLTGGIAGITALASIYRFYLVTAIEVEWRVTNREAFPVEVGLTCTTYDLVTTVVSLATATDALENPFSSGVRSLSVSGGQDRTVIKKTFSLANVWGNRREYLSDAQFVGPNNGNPATMLYLNMIAIAPNNFTALGQFNGLRIRYQVRWFTRLNLLN